MAGSRKDVEVVISAVDRFTSTLGKVTAALGALYGVYKLAEEGIKQAEEQEAAETKLAVALGRTSKALLDHASAMQLSTKFSDDAVITAQATVAAFIKDEDQIRKVTAAAADLATAYGMDLNSAAQLLTKSIAGSTNAMSRYGIEIEGAAGSNARLESALAGVNRAFGGQAEAAGQTFTGSITRLKNAWGDLLEVFGNVIVRNPAVIKLINMLAGGLGDAGARANNMKTHLRDLVRDGLALAVEGVGWLVKGLEYLHLGWEGEWVAANFFIMKTASGLRDLMNLLVNGVLSPFDMLLDKLVSLGAIKSNPFDNISASLQQFSESSTEVFNKSLDNALSLKTAYDKTAEAILGAADALRNTDVSQETAPEVGGGIQALQDENTIRTELLMQRYEAQKALAMEYGEWGAERIAIEDEAMDAKLVTDYEKFAAQGASKAEVEYYYDTMRMQRLAMTTQRQMALEKMRVQAAMSALSDGMKFTQTMYQRGGAHARSYFSMYKAMATGQALISTYGAAVAGFKSGMETGGPIGPVLGALYAGLAIAAGMAQVSQIRSQTMDGGGGGGGNAYSSMTLPTATPPTEFPGQVPALGEGTGDQSRVPTNVYVTVNNPLSTDNWQAIAEQHIIPALNTNGDRGVQLQPNVVAAS